MATTFFPPSCSSLTHVHVCRADHGSIDRSSSKSLSLSLVHSCICPPDGYCSPSLPRDIHPSNKGYGRRQRVYSIYATYPQVRTRPSITPIPIHACTLPCSSLIRVSRLDKNLRDVRLFIISRLPEQVFILHI
jgi:hypothetical protein